MAVALSNLSLDSLTRIVSLFLPDAVLADTKYSMVLLNLFPFVVTVWFLVSIVHSCGTPPTFHSTLPSLGSCEVSTVEISDRSNVTLPLSFFVAVTVLDSVLVCATAENAPDTAGAVSDAVAIPAAAIREILLMARSFLLGYVRGHQACGIVAFFLDVTTMSGIRRWFYRGSFSGNRKTAPIVEAVSGAVGKVGTRE